MTISKLIQQLQEIQDQHGDILIVGEDAEGLRVVKPSTRFHFPSTATTDSNDTPWAVQITL